jgi:hypothetical protein
MTTRCLSTTTSQQTLRHDTLREGWPSILTCRSAWALKSAWRAESAALCILAACWVSCTQKEQQGGSTGSQ